MEFTRTDPAIVNGRTFDVNEALEALPLRLGGNTYPSCQKNNLRTKLNMFLKTLEEMGYLRTLGREGRGSERYAFRKGQYEALTERLKK